MGNAAYRLFCDWVQTVEIFLRCDQIAVRPMSHCPVMTLESLKARGERRRD